MKPDAEAIQLSPSANPGSALLKQKRKRIWLSDSEKYSILKWMDANNANQKQTFVHFGIGRSTMSDLVKERERLYQSAFNGSLDTRGRKTKKHAKISKRIDAM
jgi:shikimate kinase